MRLRITVRVTVRVGQRLRHRNSTHVRREGVGRTESFPGPRDVWGPRYRSKILKKVLPDDFCLTSNMHGTCTCGGCDVDGSSSISSSSSNSSRSSSNSSWNIWNVDMENNVKNIVCIARKQNRHTRTYTIKKKQHWWHDKGRKWLEHVYRATTDY